MKILRNRLMYISLLTLLLVGTVGQKVAAQEVSVSYQTFYDNLSPYGQWVSDPQYGNVWIPNEGSDFRPYGTNGHWVMTDYGNTWVSDDPWGWACYHYGRWTYDPYYGWVWIPGYEWAPAWVSWRFGGGYCGWAPLGPGIDAGVGYNCPNSWWVFMAPQYMYQPNCIHYWRGPSYNGGYIRQAAFVNNTYADNGTHVRYNYGPRADAIQQVTHQPLQVYHVAQGNRPGAPSISGNNVSMYRPAVNRATASTAHPANVIPAPRQIGKPQAATSSAGKQAPFRQQVQNGTINKGNAGPKSNAGAQPARQPQQAAHNSQPQVNKQPQPQHNQPQVNRQPQQQHNQPQVNRQPPAAPHNQPQVNRQQQQPRQQPQRQQPVQQSHQQPMQQPRQQPMPQQHMEAPRQAAPPPREEAPRGEERR